MFKNNRKLIIVKVKKLVLAEDIVTKQKIKEKIIKRYALNKSDLREYGEDEDLFISDWVDVMIEETLSGNFDWNKEIEFIYFNCNHKIRGIRAYVKPHRISYMATIDLPIIKNGKRTGGTHQISCGTFTNITLAIKARKDAEKKRASLHESVTKKKSLID